MYSCRSKKSKADSFIISIIFLSLFLIPNILSLPSPPISLSCLLPGGSPTTRDTTISAVQVKGTFIKLAKT